MKNLHYGRWAHGILLSAFLSSSVLAQEAVQTSTGASSFAKEGVLDIALDMSGIPNAVYADAKQNPEANAVPKPDSEDASQDSEVDIVPEPDSEDTIQDPDAYILPETSKKKEKQ